MSRLRTRAGGASNTGECLQRGTNKTRSSNPQSSPSGGRTCARRCISRWCTEVVAPFGRCWRASSRWHGILGKVGGRRARRHQALNLQQLHQRHCRRALPLLLRHQCPELPTLNPPGRRSLRHWRSTHADNRPTGIERHLQVRSPNLRAVTNHRQRPLAQAFYSCYPSVAAADVCWPSPPTSMLCMNNPWDKEVRRLGLDTCLLPTVQPPATPEPFALTLDNGTYCRLITGGTRRARSDGYVPFYACRADSTPSVLGEAGSETDRSTAQDPCGQ